MFGALEKTHTTMDQKTALETLIQIDNRRTYCVASDEWHNVYNHGVAPESRTEYRITVFPISRDEMPTQFGGKKLGDIMQRAIQFIQSENAK